MIVDFIFADEISQRHCRVRGKLDHECTLYSLFMESCMYSHEFMSLYSLESLLLLDYEERFSTINDVQYTNF